MLFSNNLDHLSDLEKEIIEYIENNAHDISNMSITELAENTYSSIATVSRAIKKAGMTGFAELRYKSSLKIKNDPMTQDINSVLEKSLVETIKTIENININEVKEAVNAIKSSNRIFIIANGLSSYVSEELDLKLSLLGYNIFTINDENIIKKIDRLINHNDLLIIITLFDTLENLSVAAKNCKNKGAHILQISCNQNSRITKYSDINIFGYKESTHSFKEFEVSTRIPLFIITRILIDYLIQNK